MSVEEQNGMHYEIFVSVPGIWEENGNKEEMRTRYRKIDELESGRYSREERK